MIAGNKSVPNASGIGLPPPDIPEAFRSIIQHANEVFRALRCCANNTLSQTKRGSDYCFLASVKTRKERETGSSRRLSSMSVTMPVAAMHSDEGPMIDLVATPVLITGTMRVVGQHARSGDWQPADAIGSKAVAEHGIPVLA